MITKSSSVAFPSINCAKNAVRDESTSGHVATWDYQITTETARHSISYDSGPKYVQGHCHWKRCSATKDNMPSGILLEGRAVPKMPGTNYFRDLTYPMYSINPGAIPTLHDMTSELVGKFRDQLDLNTSDAVLLYSGILQAVPLVGGCFKFLSIFKEVGSKFLYGMRHRPFSTVVRSAIQADFIDRFVVSPTIDDARKFMNSHNFVVNTINTAYRRQSGLETAYKAESSYYDQKDSGTSTYSVQPFMGNSSWSLERGTRQQLFVQADVAYNTSSISPIKLWMARCGITRPLDSVWDLIPFSFVIDYFTRAGDFISGLSDKMSGQDGLRGKIQNIRSAWLSTKVFARYTLEFSYPTALYALHWFPDDGKIDYCVPGKGTCEKSTYSRVPFNILPALLSYTEDSSLIKLSLSTTRIRTLAELFIQARH